MADKQITIEVAYDDNGATAKLKELDRTINGVGTTSEGQAMTGMQKLGAAIGIGLVGAAVLAVVKLKDMAGELIATADAIQRVSDTTGMSIRAVQELGFVATQSGNTLEGMTTAITQMQNRLSSGDDSAIAALQTLGINIQALMRMKPDEQFYVIAKALQAVGNDAKFTELGMDLFGRGFKQVAASARANMNDLRDAAPVMSAAMVEALDKVGDAWKWAGLKAKVAGTFFLGGVVDVVKAASGVSLWQALATALGDVDVMATKVSDSLTKAGDAAFNAAERGLTPLSLSAKELKKIEADLDKEARALWDKQVKEAEAAAKKIAAAAEKAAEEATTAFLAMWKDSARGGREAVADFQNSFKTIGGMLTQVNPSTRSVGTQFEFLKWQIEGVSDTVSSKFLPLMPALEGNMTKVAVSSGKSFGAMRGIGAALEGIGRAAEMSGHRTVAALAGIGQAALAGWQSGGVWGAIAGGGLALLSTVGNALFKTEEKKVNDLRDAFIGAAGGLDALNQKAVAAGTTLNALLKAKTVKDYEAAVAALNTTLEKTAALQGELARLQQQFADRSIIDMETARQIAERYGRTVESLGPKFAEAKLAADWKTIIDDWETLRDWGISIGEAIDIMGPKIQEVVLASAKFGTTVPENMRPLIQAMIDAGLLLDENGNKITDISKIKFGDPLVSEVDKLVKAIAELVALLTGKLKPALDALGQPIPAPWQNWPPAPDGSDGDGSGKPRKPGPSYAGGTRGQFVDFGAGTRVTLHGRERVMTAREGAGAAPITVNVYNPDIDSSIGLDRFTRRLEQSLDRAARRARVS